MQEDADALGWSSLGSAGTSESGSGCRGEGDASGSSEELTDKHKLQVLRREFLKLREEHTKLQAELADLPKLKAKVKLLNMLQEDRRVLMEELATSNEKLAELVQENRLLKETNQELAVENKKMREQALKLNQYLDLTVDNLKRTTVQATRSVEANRGDKIFQERFCLPDSEPLIASYSCFDAKMRGGKLYLSPAYLCFGTHFSKLQGDGDTIIKLQDILEIRKVRSVSRSPPIIGRRTYVPFPAQEKIFQLGMGGARSLQFTLSETEVLTFRGFINRDKAVENILEQARKFRDIVLVEE